MTMFSPLPAGQCSAVHIASSSSVHIGAAAGSGVLYNRVKGETEDALRALSGNALVVLRPSLLDGPRAERRPGEALALALTRPVRLLLPDFDPTGRRRRRGAVNDRCRAGARSRYRSSRPHRCTVPRIAPSDDGLSRYRAGARTSTWPGVSPPTIGRYFTSCHSGTIEAYKRRQWIADLSGGLHPDRLFWRRKVVDRPQAGGVTRREGRLRPIG